MYSKSLQLVFHGIHELGKYARNGWTLFVLFINATNTNPLKLMSWNNLEQVYYIYGVS